MVPTDVIEPQHLLVQQSDFATDHFWAALNRLAHRLGHDGHQTYLAGQREPTNQYALHCMTCQPMIASMIVERQAPTSTS